MEGFSTEAPITVKVTWSDAEVGLLNPVQTPEGLRAETADANGILTRWFVPWAHVSYIKQTLDEQASGLTPVVTPTIPTPPPAQTGD